MNASWPEPRWLLAAGFLLTQAAMVHWIAGTELLPAAPDLGGFAPQVADWKRLADEPVPADVATQLKADRLLSRSYIHQSAGDPAVASLFVAWFQSQRNGDRQPHSPKVCLPGAGWTPISSGEIALDTTAGRITVNRYLVANQGARAAILYWYQTRDRAIAGEWASKLWLVVDAFRARRTDTALVRIVVPVTGNGDEAAFNAAAAFARDSYPMLRERLLSNTP